jgi:hypothetical protein
MLVWREDLVTWPERQEQSGTKTHFHLQRVSYLFRLLAMCVRVWQCVCGRVSWDFMQLLSVYTVLYICIAQMHLTSNLMGLPSVTHTHPKVPRCAALPLNCGCQGDVIWLLLYGHLAWHHHHGDSRCNLPSQSNGCADLWRACDLAFNATLIRKALG